MVGLSWAVIVSLLPGHHPWAIGSTDGSVWNAMFVFNGLGKVGGAPLTEPGGPGPLRLLVSTGWHSDAVFGCALLSAADVVVTNDGAKLGYPVTPLGISLFTPIGL